MDDDESVREGTRTLLRSVGYEVRTFASAETLLESGALARTKCLILDVRMPGMDGLELQRRMRAEGCLIPVIFITAHEEVPLRQQALAMGAVGVLRKPFRASALLACLETALGE